MISLNTLQCSKEALLKNVHYHTFLLILQFCNYRLEVANGIKIGLTITCNAETICLHAWKTIHVVVCLYAQGTRRRKPPYVASRHALVSQNLESVTYLLILQIQRMCIRLKQQV